MGPLSRFTLSFDDGAWLWGPRAFTRAGGSRPAGPPRREWAQFCGHYRSYSPWFTNFRVVLRYGRLVLIAPGGIEAPGQDVELVPLGESTFRMGADSRLPERITFGPSVNGVAPWADRDGCHYSRAFTD